MLTKKTKQKVTLTSYKNALHVIRRFEEQQMAEENHRIKLFKNGAVDLISNTILTVRSCRAIKEYLLEHFDEKYNLANVPKSVLVQIDVNLLKSYKNLGKVNLESIRTYINSIKAETE